MFCVAAVEIVTAACAGTEAASATTAANAVRLVIIFPNPSMTAFPEGKFYAKREQNENIIAHRTG
jgi:hypothetical protein